MTGAGAHRISGVVCQLLRLPEFEEGKGDSGQDTLIVRVRTDTGLEGIGEVEGHSSVAMAVIDAPTVWYKASGLRNLLIGADPLDTEVLWRKMYNASGFYGRHAVVIQAMAGIDMALWDLKGKILQLPLYKLLGGRQHTSLRAYASILFQADGDATAALAASLVGRGYDAVKFGWGPFGESEAKDVDLVAGARRGLGPDRTLLVDAACAYPDARTALSRVKAFEPYRLGWIEEPLSPDDLSGYRWLRDRSPIAVAAGENESGRQEFQRWIDAKALDYFQVDLGKCGVTDAVKIASRVEDAGFRVVNHCYKTPVSIAACLHWLVTCPSAFLFEDCVEDSPLRNDLTHERVQAVGGKIAPPEGFGLGITLNEDVVGRLLVAESGREAGAAAGRKRSYAELEAEVARLGAALKQRR